MEDNGILARLEALKEDQTRLEQTLVQLDQNLERSLTKQGERLGEAEKGLITLKNDFWWMIRIAGLVWVVIQAIVELAVVRFK